MLLWVTVVGGVGALVAQAMSWSAIAMGPSAALTIASFVSSAALLGGSCTAMILGHWYLVLPSMDVSLLQRMVKFHVGSTIARIVVVGAVIAAALANWQSPGGAGFERYVLSIEGIFFWQRLLFGLLAPAVLAYLTWETAKIQSTQSATGILYVNFFTVIVGEVLAKCQEHVMGGRLGKGIIWVDLTQADELDRLLLVERPLISRQHAAAEDDLPRGVAIGAQETYSIMLNEEDHMRIQVLRSGMYIVLVSGL